MHRDKAAVLAGLERTLVPTYPYFAAFGTLCFLADLTLDHGRARLLALVWLVVVPLWIRRFLIHRRRQS